MKEKILLINPPIRETAPPSMFPSGLGYIAAILLKENYDVKVLDINGYRYDKETVKKSLYEFLINQGIDFVGIGCLITCYNYAKWLIQTIKEIKPETTVIVGGGLGSSIPEICLNKMKADIIVIGEGENTILDMLKTLLIKKDLSKVKGIAFKKNGRVIRTPLRERIKNLDELPLPAWNLFPMHIYLKNPFEVEALMDLKKKSVNIITNRGCPYNCTFCYETFTHLRTTRSPENVIKEIKILKQEYNAELFLFSDDLFCVDKKWASDFCDLLLKENLNIKWFSAMRVNILDEPLLRKMKKAGCLLLNYGIESGSQKMLDVMRKGITTEDSAKAIAVTRKVGLRLNLSFMMGFPEETKETLQETINFCIQNNIHLTAIFFVTPYPRTALYEQARQIGLIKDEEEFISRLGNATELTINLTKWSDEELVNLRNWVISSVHKAYYKKHKLEYIQWLRKKIVWYGNYIKSRGLRTFISVKAKQAKDILFR